MLLEERSKAVFPTEACEERAFLRCSLPIQIKLGSPPGLDSVLQCQSAGEERVRAFCRGSDTLAFDFESTGGLFRRLFARDGGARQSTAEQVGNMVKPSTTADASRNLHKCFTIQTDKTGL